MRHVGRTVQREGVDVLAVVTASHELLAKTNGVLALGDVVEDLELLLRDALLERQSCDTPVIQARDVRAGGSTSPRRGYRHP